MIRKVIVFLFVVPLIFSACLPTPAPTEDAQLEEAEIKIATDETEPATEQTSEVSETSEVLDPPTPTSIGTVTADFDGTPTDIAEILRNPLTGTLEAKLLNNSPIKVDLSKTPIYSLNFALSGYSVTANPYSGTNYQVLADSRVAFTNGASGKTVPVTIDYKLTGADGKTYDLTMAWSFNVTGTLPTQPPKGGNNGGNDGSGSGGSGGGNEGGGGTEPPCEDTPGGCTGPQG